MKMKLISIVTPCYNEEENILEIYNQVKEVINKFPQYRYEHIFIDNASKDNTVNILKEIAQKDKNIKIIINSRNFGHLRSPYYALFQTKGDAVILIASDLQDPPYLIEDMIKKWEEGYKIVKAVKAKTKETPIMFFIRKFFYSFINKISEIELTKNFYGYGIYDKTIIETLEKIDEPYPYLRGLISDIGFEYAIVEFSKPERKRGITKNNFYTLYDIAMLGITNHSKIPLRLATFIGFVSGCISLMVAVVYFIYKLLFWDRFDVGMAPLVIGLFFFTSIQLFFIGVIGEYIGSIYTQVKKRPLVIEKERINFPTNDQSSENDS
jgi:glycosyltransferase involved in cell wall biosynthesis